MQRLRPLLVIGTRPEAIKMAPVVKAMQACAAQIDGIVCLTGQHEEMLDPAIRHFDISPDIELRLMRPSQSLASFSARCLEGLDAVLKQRQPDCVVAQGDTTTVMAAALASSCEIRRG